AVSRALEADVRRPGQRVALVLPNASAFVAGFFGAARTGAVVAPLYARFRARELAYHLDDLDPVAVLTDPDSTDIVRSALEISTRQPTVVALSPPSGIELVRRGHGDGAVLATSGTPLLQQYTSGSTGAPKRIVRTHAALLAEIETLASTLDLGPEDRFLGVAPFSHVNGLVRTMMTAMHVGGRLYPLEEFGRRSVLDLLARERISYFCGVAQMFTLLSYTTSRESVDLRALRVVLSSSAPLRAEDNRRVHARHGFFVRQLYGSTETGTISLNREPSVDDCLDSVGTPVPGVDIDIVGEGGGSLPPGEPGEVVITSPFAANEYVGNREATEASFRNGSYFSGDLGVRDVLGRLRLTGRIKLMINRGGFKISPDEIEDVVGSHPCVSEAAVARVPGVNGEDAIRCVIVPAAPCSADDILRHCRERLADFKIPTRIEFRDALPRSPAGKILRGAL
ncbi:MAG: class I adenylate-forming enzyme family protein, partial [Gammaproteobacteria bacterium]